jgi:DnaB-like helicase N terminal domain
VSNAAAQFLEAVVSAFEEGHSAEEIARRHPALDLGDVYLIIGLYLKGRALYQALSVRSIQTERIPKEEHPVPPGAQEPFLDTGLRRLAERAVLGGLLLDPTLLPDVAGRLAPPDFLEQRHQILFQAMLDLWNEQAVITLGTLRDKLRKQLDPMGGLAYVASLDLDLPDISHLELYVEIIKARSPRRKRSRL